MIPATQITLTLYEGPHNLTDKPQTASTWKEANQTLSQWKTILNPDDTGYYKAGFTITFADGETLSDRYDIDTRTPDLTAAVRNYLNFAAGTNKPPHWTQAQYQTVLDRNPELSEKAKRLLANYAIGDYHEPKG